MEQQDTSAWLRPFTSKRYLHPPFSEYLYTLWADFKLLCGVVEEKTCGYRSCAVKLLLGEKPEALDFRKSEAVGREDGLPLHLLRYETPRLRITMEAFCQTGRRVPVAFSRITVYNKTHTTVSDQLALLPRTGREDHLVGMEVDGYAHFDDNVHNYGFLHSDWVWDGAGWATDREYELQLGENEFGAVWQGDENGLDFYQRRLLRLPFVLGPKQSKTLTLMLRPYMDAPRGFDYEQERRLAAAFWTRELGRIRRVPDSDAHRDVVNNLTVQCLQMFAFPQGKSYVIPRQGCLQRVCWPVEANEFLLALDELGGFGDYSETVFDTYFHDWQCKSGEDRGGVFTNIKWAGNTGAALWSCAHYLSSSGSGRAWQKYADDLYEGFLYIQRMRAKSAELGCIGTGIFPAMKSSDWPGEYQSWCITDCTNLEGLRCLAEAFAHFGDPRAAEVRAAYGDYMACMKKLLADEVAKNTRPDEILLTNKIGVELTDPPTGPYFDDGPSNLLRVGVIDPNSETAHLVEAYFRHRNCMRAGMTGLMNDGLIFQGHNADPWAGHTWYMSSSDHWWFLTWLAQGEREKARQTLEAQLYYGMSEAYQLMERYADNDPYWVPWQPNASANGRLLQMLFRFYGVKDVT